MTKRLSILFIALFAVVIAYGQRQLPSDDLFPGVVWVKIKEAYRDSIAVSRPAGRLKNGLKIHAVNPLLLPQASKKNRSSSARSFSDKQIDISLYFEIHFDRNEPVADFIERLKTTPYFDAVEPVSRNTRPLSIPFDPLVGQQYYLNIIQAYDAWDIAKGDGGIVVAIIDTGGDLDHPDIQQNLFVNENEPIDGQDNDGDGYIDNRNGWDFSGARESEVTLDFYGDNNPSVFSGGILGHGTKVAGCVAATPNNGTGIAGIGYHTKLLFTKHVADDSPSGIFSSSTYKGVLYAATHGAKIINCSWGRKGNPSSIEQDIITHVTLDLGCLVIAAAGNDNTAEIFYPASYDYVVSVAASNSSDLKHTNSSFGKTVDITAPGAGILTTSFNNDYSVDNGTSLASPIVAGAAALVWEKNPAFTPLQVAEQLRASADNSFYQANAQYSFQLGKGRLNVFNALTQQIPSIRAINPKLLGKNGNTLTPGDSGKLSLDFINFLKPSSSSLIVTASSTSPYVTINKIAVGLGTINTLDTLRNQSDLFSIILSKDTPPVYEIDIILHYYDGAYDDFQVITLKTPSYQNITENNLTTSLIANGRIGFGNPASQREGYGFLYNDQQMTSEIGLIMGNSASNLFSNTRSGSGQYKNDFIATKVPAKFTPGERSYSEIHGAFRNTDETLLVDYKSLVWKKETGSNYNDFVIIEYTIKNTSLFDLSSFYFGVFADWNVSPDGHEDMASWEPAKQLGYIGQAQGSELPCSGIQVLKGIPNYFAIENDVINDDYNEVKKFAHISGGLINTVAGAPSGSDVSHVVSSGPHTILAGNEVVIVLAFHGASNFTGLQHSARYADSLYNFTLQAARPVISPLQVCYAKDAVFSAEGAAKYNWYKDFTGGTPLTNGPTFTFSALVKDTSVFVANADHSYESVRSEAKVIVNSNPAADFTYQVNALHSDEVMFTDQSTNADSWSWDFGDGSTSTEKDPVHIFEPGKNFTVILTVRSGHGCEDETSNVFLITGISEDEMPQVSVFPNPLKTDKLMLYCPALDSEILKIEITDSTGKIIKNVSPLVLGNEIDLSSCRNGFYFVRFHLREGIKTIKFVKEK
jgi:serine protease